jgi:hypothetical protein
MSAGWGLAGLALGGTLAFTIAGCIVFTGSSNGYSTSEASTPGQGCASSADCPGQMCCYDLASGSPAATCTASCAPTFQSCTQASDCGDGGSCLVQSCHVDAGGFAVSLSVSTCGAVSVCTQ